VPDAQPTTDAPDTTAPPAQTDSFADLLDDKSTVSALRDVQRAKVREESGFMDAEAHALAQDRTRAVNFLDREGVGPNDLQKWDVKAESEKYRTDPIEQFGSLASVFAIAASAFTKAPMENALNGAAAAMNAARAGNDKEYERAYQAWKDNNELVIKRHQMMHQDYTDALSLMTQDTATGDARLRQMAAKYGDQQALTLLDHGYAPQLIEMIQARAKAAQGLMQVQMQSDEYTMRKAAWDSWKKQNPNAKPDEQMATFEVYMGAKTDMDREFMRRYWAANPSSGDPKTDLDNFTAAWRKYNEAKYPYRNALKPGSREESLALQRAAVTEEHAGEEGWDPATPQGQARIDTEANRRVTANRTKRTEGAISVEDRDAKSAEYQKELGLPKTEADARAARWVKLNAAVPSGNRVDQLRGRADQIKYAKERVDEVEQMLKRHNAITGLGGKLIGRPTEVMSNILGGKSTDYKQFERTVNELQQLMPRILTDSPGRPLGVEAGHIGSVVAGLNAGDTLAGTVRAYTELKKQLDEMARDTQVRIQGGSDTGVALPPAATPTQSSTPRWKQFSTPGAQ